MDLGKTLQKTICNLGHDRGSGPLKDRVVGGEKCELCLFSDIRVWRQLYMECQGQSKAVCLKQRGHIGIEAKEGG